jgi:exopolysaccharide production protein ExoQ
VELSANLEWTDADQEVLPMSSFLGFFFAFRGCLTFLFFQADPVAGSAVTVLLGLLLLTATIFCSAGTKVPAAESGMEPSTAKWVIAFLGLTALSLSWSDTPSYLAATGYWTGLAADVSIVWWVCHHHDPIQVTLSMMKGFVWGTCIVAIIAWVSPVTADLRLGNEDFLHPNPLGWQFALATVFSQYLSHRQRLWRWMSIAMAVSLLRTLSKTSIAAFAIGETFYVLHESRINRRARIQIGLVAAAVVFYFWGLLDAYADIYATEGSSPETLTGRTILWTRTLGMALEKPWLGYGLHSFHTDIPALGTFEPWHAHNELLQQFFAYGAAGVIVVSGMYLSFYKQARRTPSLGAKTLAMTILIMAIIRGIADTDRFDLSLPLWLLTLLSLSLARRTISERPSDA